MGTYALPRQLLRVTKSANNRIDFSTVTVTDPKATFQMGALLSAFSDDDVQVDYQDGIPGGLLDKVSTTTADRTGDIITQLAKTVAYRAGETAPQPPPPEVLLEYDPFKPDEARTAREVLKTRADMCIEVEITENVWSGCDPASQAASPSYLLPSQRDGIYFRRAALHRVRVKEGGKFTRQFNIAFANDQPIQKLNIDRAFLVQNKATIDFNNGELISVHKVKPSEALAVAELPLEVIKAVIAAPVDAISDHKKLQDAKAEYYKSVASRIQAEGAIPANERLDRTGVAGFRQGGFQDTARQQELCDDIGIRSAERCSSYWSQ
ncbi:hypothetical protein X971_4897 (plasmid) [Agrobacterium tumefaciens LBA4213 (Ach5)]|nr:hypothetical protein X971_4897 [Agrobacterium tumefaciens LBA4213 (Ach5)]